MMWYLEDLQRSHQEREALEALASEVSWLTPVGWRIDGSARMIWDADIATPGGTRPISLRYPNHFPYSPPLVLPRGDTQRWSLHQYGPGGELCLEYGPDNWHAGISGADMISSAYRLLEGERPTADQTAVVASRHKTTLGQDLRGAFSRLLVTRSLVEALAQVPDDTILPATTVGMYHGDSYVHLIASLTLPNGEIWRDDLPESGKLGYERQIAVLRWPVGTALPSTASLSMFRAALADHQMELAPLDYVVIVRGTRIRVYFLDEKNDGILETSVIPLQPFRPRLDEDHARLADRKVAIVGGGSLGSKLAVSLARAGVGGFLVIDDDILLPDNLVRNDLDWREVGTHKADSVVNKIKLVNPKANCATRKQRVGGQESSGSIEALLEHLGGYDLIVDATADAAVFNYLTAAVGIAKKPLLWAEVFGGGFGGLIARHRPGLDPEPAQMRGMIENWCADRGHPIERAAIDYGGGPDSSAIADDADVAVIAAHAARMAIDMLMAREPSIFPYSVYLIGLARSWIFEQPFETHPIDVGQPIPHVEEALDEGLAKGELERIKALFKEYIDAASSGPRSDETTPA